MASALQEYFAASKETLIGLEYIDINIVDEDAPTLKAFACFACGCARNVSSPNEIIEHVNSIGHQMTYLVRRKTPSTWIQCFTNRFLFRSQIFQFPKISQKIIKQVHPGNRSECVLRICDQLESLNGRATPRLSDGYQFNRITNAIRTDHLREFEVELVEVIDVSDESPVVMHTVADHFIKLEKRFTQNSEPYVNNDEVISISSSSEGNCTK